MINLSSRTKSHSTFLNLALLTVLTVYLLILVGGIVRSTGSGMGCPDWPKCFGQWVPPTNADQLPSNYQEIYSHQGYADTTFNVVKTWTEYLNRVFGVFTGFFIFLTFAASLRYWRRDVVIVIVSFLAFILVGFQGWLGSVVVASVLAPWLVTLHMLLALIIVGLLLYVVVRSYLLDTHQAYSHNTNSAVNTVLIASIFLSIVQVLLGTQVREHIDEIAKTLGEGQRENWISSLGTTFFIHRSYSLVVLVVQVWSTWLIIKHNKGILIHRIAIALVALTIAEIASGAYMAYAGIPPWAQPVHLTLATLILGIQFTLLLLLNKRWVNVGDGEPTFGNKQMVNTI